MNEIPENMENEGIGEAHALPGNGRRFLPSKKFILDACCGGRMMWFDKKHPNAIYIDNRETESEYLGTSKFAGVRPDLMMDFRAMGFPDKTFKLVVFDPPHLINVSPKSMLGRKFGSLDELHWANDLKMALNECWRVLDDYGILLFKWNDVHIAHRKILELIEFKPLFMNVAKEKKAKEGSHRSCWFCFMKIAREVIPPEQAFLAASKGE